MNPIETARLAAAEQIAETHYRAQRGLPDLAAYCRECREMASAFDGFSAQLKAVAAKYEPGAVLADMCRDLLRQCAEHGVGLPPTLIAECEANGVEVPLELKELVA